MTRFSLTVSATNVFERSMQLDKFLKRRIMTTEQLIITPVKRCLIKKKTFKQNLTLF